MYSKLEIFWNKIKGLPGWAGWLCAALASLAGAVCLIYTWRVFYYLDVRSEINVPLLTLSAAGLALALVAAVRLVSRCRDFAARGAVCVLLCGLLFVFANPPMQAPDEYNHYLRSYSVSQGHFDFDGSRAYPEDVARLYYAFPGAWVNAHTSIGVAEEENGDEFVYDTTGYALKQYGEDGAVLSIWDSFGEYFSGKAVRPVTEPIVVMILPFVPQAIGMMLARLFGLGALGCLYLGRVGNLVAYTLICYAALKNCRRAAPLFLAVMLLPLSLFLGGSLSYDATLLPCYYLMLSFLDKESFEDGDAWTFLLAFGYVNMAKPAINLLWVFVPLFVCKKQWKCRLPRLGFGAVALAAAVGVTVFTTWYGNAFRHDYNYDAFARMIEGADQIPQLMFVLKHLPRFAAVLVTTLYENEFFIGQLGSFGSLDLTVPLLNLTGPLVLLMGAVLSTPKQHKTLRPLPMVGLGGFSVLYLAGAMTAMYITYTPVAMVRIIGLQARYFLPVFLALFWLLAQGLSRYLQPARREPEALALSVFGGHAVLGALLLFQHYFIGPVYTIG